MLVKTFDRKSCPCPERGDKKVPQKTPCSGEPGVNKTFTWEGKNPSRYGWVPRERGGQKTE